MINSLDKLKLLHHLMRVCPLPDLQFESLFVKIRSLLLSNLDDIEETPEFIYFLSRVWSHVLLFLRKLQTIVSFSETFKVQVE